MSNYYLFITIEALITVSTQVDSYDGFDFVFDIDESFTAGTGNFELVKNKTMDVLTALCVLLKDKDAEIFLKQKDNAH